MEFRLRVGSTRSGTATSTPPSRTGGEAPKFLETAYKFLCDKTDKKEHKMKAVPGTLKMLWVLPWGRRTQPRDLSSKREFGKRGSSFTEVPCLGRHPAEGVQLGFYVLK